MTSKVIQCRAFSLVEILVAIAVIGILSGLAVSFIGGASEQSSLVVARQQQVQLQSALDSWIAAQSSGTAGLVGAQAAYSSDASAMLSALAPYLREPDIFSVSGGGVSSAALSKAGKTLQFSSWASGSYPKVLMQ
jgi:prepilin-type N-terminal cleavage/methylation domain-containing protein